MKKIAFHSLAAAMMLGAGCAKKYENETAKTTNADNPATNAGETAVQIAEQPAQAARKVKEPVDASIILKTDEVLKDLDYSIVEVRQRVAGLDRNQALAYANTYREVLIDKMDQLNEWIARLKELTVSEAAGEKGKVLKAEIAKRATQLTELKDRYDLYLTKLREFGVDASAFRI